MSDIREITASSNASVSSQQCSRYNEGQVNLSSSTLADISSPAILETLMGELALEENIFADNEPDHAQNSEVETPQLDLDGFWLSRSQDSLPAEYQTLNEWQVYSPGKFSIARTKHITDTLPERYEISTLQVPAFGKPPEARSSSYTIETILWKDPTQKLSSFDKFPELPPELRRLVWKRALPQGRIVDFSRIIQRDNLIQRPWVGPQLAPIMPQLSEVMPGHLLACHEALDVFLERYSKFNIEFDEDWSSLPFGQKITGWFDYEKDTLMMCESYLGNMYEWHTCIDLSRLKRLAIMLAPVVEDDVGLSIRHLHKIFRRSGPKLSEVTLVRGTGTSWRYLIPGDVQLVELDEGLRDAILDRSGQDWVVSRHDHFGIYSPPYNKFVDLYDKLSEHLDWAKAVRDEYAKSFAIMSGQFDKLERLDFKVALFATRTQVIPISKVFVVPWNPEQHPRYRVMNKSHIPHYIQMNMPDNSRAYSKLHIFNDESWILAHTDG